MMVTRAVVIMTACNSTVDTRAHSDKPLWAHQFMMQTSARIQK